MKKRYEITHCENCDKMIEIASIKDGEIEVSYGSAIMQTDSLTHLSARKDFSGHYCSMDCLIKYLEKLENEK